MKFEEDIKLILNKKIIGGLVSCNRAAKPIESCGLIFGEIKQVALGGDKYQIHYIGKKFYCLKSNIESHGSFALIEDSEKYFEIHDEAVNKFGFRMISIFHSHPVAPFPSGIDEHNMKYLDKDIGRKKNPFKNQIWTIMDMGSEKLNTFIYFKDELLQVELKIEE